MTELQFISECTYRTIIPSVAFENKEIQKALKNRDVDLVLELLDELF